MSLRPRLYCAALLACALLPAASFAAEPGGSLKALAVETLDSESPAPERLLSAGLRLEAKKDLGGLKTELALEARLLGASPARLLTEPPPNINRRLDLERSSDSGSWRSTLALDRLSLQGTAGELRWRAGRQAIGFGRAALRPAAADRRGRRCGWR